MSTLEQLIQRCRKNLEQAHKGACDCWMDYQTAYSENRFEDCRQELYDTNKFIELFTFFASKLALFTKMQENTLLGETNQEEWMMTSMQ